jgi:hypothetical protein
MCACGSAINHLKLQARKIKKTAFFPELQRRKIALREGADNA